MMDELIHIHKTFDKVVLMGSELRHREFEGCVFNQCDFSNSDFSGNTFSECEFIDCNLSMLLLGQTSLQDVSFRNCKLLGIQFQHCNDFLFEVSFEQCALDYASFAHKKMPKTKFINCSMKETVLVGTNLTQAFFDQCNLENAVFNETQLAEADFTTAINYKIDPQFNPMKKAKFSTSGILGLLSQYDIKIE